MFLRGPKIEKVEGAVLALSCNRSVGVGQL